LTTSDSNTTTLTDVLNLLLVFYNNHSSVVLGYCSNPVCPSVTFVKGTCCFTSTYTYVLQSLLEHWARSCLHRARSLATLLVSSVSLPLTPVSCISSLHVSCHVRHLLLSLSESNLSPDWLVLIDIGRRSCFTVFLWPPYVIGQAIIFCPVVSIFLLSFFLFFLA